MVTQYVSLQKLIGFFTKTLKMGEFYNTYQYNLKKKIQFSSVA